MTDLILDFPTELAKTKAAYAKSLEDREDDLQHALDRLTGCNFGQHLTLGCGCVVKIGERYWSHWNSEHRYEAVYVNECPEHK